MKSKIYNIILSSQKKQNVWNEVEKNVVNVFGVVVLLLSIKGFIWIIKDLVQVINV